jgi:long-chain fatty acid transport protein
MPHGYGIFRRNTKFFARQLFCPSPAVWLALFANPAKTDPTNPMPNSIHRQLALSGLALGFAAAGVRAEGFRNSTIGAEDLGRSGGRIAQVDDATAIQHNPANLAGITNAMAEFDPTVIYISAHFHSVTGQGARTTDPVKALPDIFVSAPLKDGKYAVGLGITVPYGLGNEWGNSSSAFAQPGGVLTYAAPHSSKLTTFNFNPTFAAKITDNLSVGVGLDVMWSDLQFSQYLSPLAPGITAHAEGDGFGYGGNLGVTWKVTDKQRLAFAYRSTMTAKYTGSTEFSSVLGLPGTSFGSRIVFPNILSAGYGIDLTDTIRLETDFEWVQFSQFKNLPATIGPNFLGVPSQVIPENWHNTFTAGIGGDWRFADHWTLRAGYQFFESPVPDSTFSPTIPDANQNVLTFGLGWHSGHHSLEAAYGLDFYDTRNIAGNLVSAYNGKYTFNVHLFSFAYRYAF